MVWLTDINNMFKKTLEEYDGENWKKICTNYTAKALLDVFMIWITSNVCNNRESKKSISRTIVLKLKNKKNISYIKTENYWLICSFFIKFLGKYDSDEDFKETINQYLYVEKIWKIKDEIYKNLWMFDDFNNWMSYMNKWDTFEKHGKKLKDIISFLSENDFIYIFWLFQTMSKKLNERNSNYHEILKEIDIIIKKEKSIRNKDLLCEINTLFSLYLHFLKNQKNISIQKKDTESVESTNCSEQSEKEWKNRQTEWHYAINGDWDVVAKVYNKDCDLNWS